jgi:hypothetical protein
MAVDWPVRRHDWVAILVAIRSKTVGRISTDPLSSEEIQGAAKWQIYNALCILLYLNVHLNLIHGVIFPTVAVFNRISMHHSDADNAEAAKKAVQLLSAKELVDGQQYFGLYLKQLQQQSKALLSLNAPMLGDALVKSDADPTFWMAPLIAKAPKLEVKDVTQQAAMPLDSFLRFDPWTDQVAIMHSSFEPILGAPDKMPLEVAPVYLKLSYFEVPAGAVVTRVISVVQSAATPDSNTPTPDSTGKH